MKVADAVALMKDWPTARDALLSARYPYEGKALPNGCKLVPVASEHHLGVGVLVAYAPGYSEHHKRSFLTYYPSYTGRLPWDHPDTMVVSIMEDGTFILSLGEDPKSGRIRRLLQQYTPVKLINRRGEPFPNVWSHPFETTPSKIKKCRNCDGTGTVQSTYDESTHECWYCCRSYHSSGTPGFIERGCKPTGLHVFQNGVVISQEGRYLQPTGFVPTLSDWAGTKTKMSPQERAVQDLLKLNKMLDSLGEVA